MDGEMKRTVEPAVDVADGAEVSDVWRLAQAGCWWGLRCTPLGHIYLNMESGA